MHFLAYVQIKCNENQVKCFGTNPRMLSQINYHFNKIIRMFSFTNKY